jgi:hypothetical protein
MNPCGKHMKLEGTTEEEDIDTIYPLIYTLVCEYLDIKSISCAALTCKRVNTILRSLVVWKNLVKRTWETSINWSDVTFGTLHGKVYCHEKLRNLTLEKTPLAEFDHVIVWRRAKDFLRLIGKTGQFFLTFEDQHFNINVYANFTTHIRVNEQSDTFVTIKGTGTARFHVLRFMTGSLREFFGSKEVGSSLVIAANAEMVSFGLVNGGNLLVSTSYESSWLRYPGEYEPPNVEPNASLKELKNFVKDKESCLRILDDTVRFGHEINKNFNYTLIRIVSTSSDKDILVDSRELDKAIKLAKRINIGVFAIVIVSNWIFGQNTLEIFARGKNMDIKFSFTNIIKYHRHTLATPPSAKSFFEEFANATF